MNITEVREGFIKFEADKKVSPSEFFEVKGMSKDYIAQVVRVRNNGINYSAYAKLLYVYDGTFKKYDKTLPDTTAELSEFPFDLIKKSFNVTKPFIAGKFLTDENIQIDAAGKKSLLVSVDDKDMLNTLTANIADQNPFKGKSLIIDMQGCIQGNRYIAGTDFKLPLNAEAINFIYKDCLNDATSESKSLIKDIFEELTAYAKSVPFLSFNAFKSIIDEMVDKEHVFKLIVLKNKLAKFEEAGYFAKTIEDSENIEKILSEKSAVIDLSGLDNVFQNRYLSVILSEIKKSESSPEIIINVSNNINKINLKTIVTDKDINAVFVTHSRFKYISEIKDFFINYIIEPTLNNREVFKLYSVFFNNTEKNTYLIVGESTNYIPLISKAERLIIKQPERIEEVLEAEINTPDTKNNEDDINPEDTEYAEKIEANEISEDMQNEQTLCDSTELTDEAEPEQETEPILSFGDDDESDIEHINTTDETPETETEIPEHERIEYKETFNEPLPEFHTSIDNTSHTELVEDIENTAADFTETDETELETVQEPEPEGEPEDKLTESNLIETSETELVNELPNDENENSATDTVILAETDSDENEAELVELEEITDEQTELISDDESDSEITDTSNESLEMAIELPEELNYDDDEIITEELNTAEDNQEIIDITESEVQDVTDVIPLETNTDDEFEIKELDESEFTEGDVLVEIGDEADTDDDLFKDSNDALEQEIVEDVDKVFTTIKDDSITDSDLDFIDELNDFDSPEDDSQELISENDLEELENFDSVNDEENELTEPIQELSYDSEQNSENKEILEEKHSSTPFVPVYEAEIPQEDMVVSDEIEQGDTVTHTKYGTGVVEKMIKYGSKNLYSINFDNVGRRLLDPTLTEIKKA